MLLYDDEVKFVLFIALCVFMVLISLVKLLAKE